MVPVAELFNHSDSVPVPQTQAQTQAQAQTETQTQPHNMLEVCSQEHQRGNGEGKDEAECEVQGQGGGVQCLRWVREPGSESHYSLVGVATCHYAAGEEVFVSYGRKRNAELLSGYGFVIPSSPMTNTTCKATNMNTHDWVEWPSPQLLNWLEAEALSRGVGFRHWCVPQPQPQLQLQCPCQITGTALAVGAIKVQALIDALLQADSKLNAGAEHQFEEVIDYIDRVLLSSEQREVKERNEGAGGGVGERPAPAHVVAAAVRAVQQVKEGLQSWLHRFATTIEQVQLALYCCD